MFLVVYYESYVGYSLTGEEKVFSNVENAQAYADKLNKEMLAGYVNPPKIEDLGDRYEVVNIEKGD